MEDTRHLLMSKIESYFATTQSQNSLIVEIFKEGVNTEQLIKKFQSVSLERDLKLKQLHIYLHSITETPACRNQEFKIRVHYGTYYSHTFEAVETKSLPRVYNSTHLQTYLSFNYQNG